MTQTIVKRREYGELRYQRCADGTCHLIHFEVYEDYRGQGYARRLAKLIPFCCELYALPLDSSTCLSRLIELYESIGFTLVNYCGKGAYMRRD